MKQRMHTLYTIGYSGYTLASFISQLQEQQIAVLLDIRMTPISRKKGFSKTALRQALESAGIEYQHIRSLGSPADLRHHLRDDKDYAAFFTSFRTYLQEQGASLNQAIQLVATHQVCLMCVEPCPDECHRSVVASAIVEASDNWVQVRHLDKAVAT